MTWHTRPNGFIESDGGRFDVFLSGFTGEWVALDSERGKTSRHESKDAAVEWCETRAQQRKPVGAARA